MASLCAFAALTALLAWLSRRSLRNARSHGFYRFLAWEAILALLILNVGYWFEDPLSVRQIIAWLLLSASAALVLAAVLVFRRHGRQDDTRQDGALLGFEKTTSLVTAGIYRYIRHPMYSSLLFLDWGVFLKQPTWPAAALALVATLFLVRTARADEAECVRFFGEPYRTYMTHTKMFIPFLL